MELFKSKLSRRLVISSKDVQALTGYTPRGSRNLLLNYKRRLGKNSKDFLYVHELSKLMKTEEEKIRSVMRIPLFFFAFMLLEVIIFRDDLDLFGTWLLLFICLKLEYPWFRRFTNKVR